MSEVSLSTPTDSPDAQSTEALLDVLYELLAEGRDPDRGPSLDEIQAFLHAHAREQKGPAEVLAFFERHGMSIDPSSYESSPELDRLVGGLHPAKSGALERPTAPTSGHVQMVPPAGPFELGAGPDRLPLAPRVPHSLIRATPRPWGWLAAAAGAAALGLLGYVAYGYAQGLERQLASSRMQQQSTDAALSALERRAGLLAADLSASQAAHTAVQQRLESYIAEEQARREAEEAERLRKRGWNGARALNAAAKPEIAAIGTALSTVAP